MACMSFCSKALARWGDEILNRRDGLGIWEADTVLFEITASSKILLMEVPMTN